MKKLLTCVLLCISSSLIAQWTSLNTGTTKELRTVSAVDANVVYAAGDNVLIKSINGGLDWTNVPLLNLSNQPIFSLVINDLHFFDAQTGIAVGAQASLTRVILRTVDGGAHWSTVVTTNDPNGWTGGYSKVHFINNTTGWAVGSSGVVSKTVNAGLNWTSITIPDVTNLFDVQFLDGQIGMVCGVNNFNGTGNQKVLAKSSNGGQSWTQWLQSSGQQIQEIYFLSPLVGLIAEADGFTYRLNDGQNIQNSSLISMVDAAPIRRFHFLNQTTGYALTDYSIRKTPNVGDFWEQTTLPLSSGQELRDFEFLADGITGFAVGKAGKAFRTLNGGEPLLPMANFYTEPFAFSQVCKDSVLHLVNPAPEAKYTSQWFINNQFYSASHEVDFNFPLAGTPYSIRLQITGPNGSSEITKDFETFPEIPDFDFGTLEWVNAPPICSGNTLTFQVKNPALNLSYVAYINNIPFQALFVNNADPLVFTTPVLEENASIIVQAQAFGPCEKKIKADTLEAEVTIYPNRNSAVEVANYLVCYNSGAEIIIHDSEVGAFYQFVNLGFEGPPVEGNGGTLSFLTGPIIQTETHQILASRGNCRWPLNQTVYIEVDAYFSQLDTFNTYGIAGVPIPINNPAQGLASVQWEFGPNASPMNSTLIAPEVTYQQSGNFLYTYHFESLGACNGTLQQPFEIYDQGAPLAGLECGNNTLFGLAWSNIGESPLILATATDTSGNLLSTGAGFQAVAWWSTMNLFLQKNNTSGDMLWQKKVDPSGPGQGADYRSSYGTGMALDPDNQIYLCGTFAANQARILDQNFSADLPQNKYQPQGFLMKLDPEGNALWSISIQSLFDNQSCGVSSVLYSKQNQRIYVIVHGPSWQAKLPDGNLAADFISGVAGWLLAFSPDGQFVEGKPLGDIQFGGLLGGFHPQLFSNNSATSTFVNPSLQEGPNGDLYVAGMVAYQNEIHFGAQTATATNLGQDLLQRNHFVAVYNPNTAEWVRAFMTHSIGSYAGINDNAAPAWRVDTSGNVWIGLGLVQPEISGFGLPSTLCKIGTEPIETKVNRGYLAKFSPTGQLNWVSRSSNMYFHELQDNGQGGMFVLAGFVRAAGFQLPGGIFQGTNGLGNKDVLLAEISGEGAGIGFRAIGTAAYDQPIALERHQPSGRIYTVFAPNLNANIQSTPPSDFGLQIYSPSGACPGVGIKELSQAPLRIELSPNPIAIGNPWALQYYLPEKSALKAELLDVLGRPVWSSELGIWSAGEHQLKLMPPSGLLKPGIYVLNLKTNQRQGLVRVVLTD